MAYRQPNNYDGPVVPVVLFTKKEIMVLQLTCEQYSSKEIAHKLDLSVRTIEAHKKNLMKKTRSRNMVGIAMHAVKHNIFSPALLPFVNIFLFGE